ncbi:MAG: hypothetical protein DRJ56_06935 [Thermoprotei archaeon]|nr:MAG: hypothetical protein DRJ56_06935 [Thermoprotei archaeon]
MSSAEGEAPVVPPPPPIVKVPVLIRHHGVPPKRYKVGRGYSVAEVKALGLTIREARKLGIYVDERRDTCYEDNVKRLAEWLDRVRRGEIRPPLPTLPKVVRAKPQRRRVFRGLTCAGRRMRGLLSVRLRETHRHKWKRKQRERELKKRHEASRAKGGH